MKRGIFDRIARQRSIAEIELEIVLDTDNPRADRRKAAKRLSTALRKIDSLVRSMFDPELTS